MRPLTLRALTWATVVAAISSALWLASVEPAWPERQGRLAVPGGTATVQAHKKAPAART
jgi:hypothetical protein